MTQTITFPISLKRFEKPSTQCVVLQRRVGCRRRGVWSNAQYTVPFRACFCCEIKTLDVLGSVDGLSTTLHSNKKLNKNSGRSM